VSAALDWCRRQKKATEETLAMFEFGQLRLYQNDRGINAGHMANLREFIAEAHELLSRTDDADGTKR